MRKWTLLLMVLVGLALVGCGGRGGSAAKMPDGRSILIQVLFDPGLTEDMDEAKQKQRLQLSDWMSADLLSMFKDAGYDVVATADEGAPTAVGRYLLKVKITHYNPGAKAARMFVGFGAGSLQLHAHFELIGADGTVAIAGDPMSSSSRDWNYSARDINTQTLDAVNAQLHRSL